MVAQPPRGVGELLVARRDRASLAGRDDLARVEREAPERDALWQRAPGDRTAEEVHGENRLRARPDLELCRVEVERVRVDVDEHGPRPGERDDVGRRRERVGGDEHLVPRLEAKREHREVEGRRSGGDRDRMLDAASTGEERLELGHLRPHREHPGLEHLGNRLELLRAERGIAEPDLHCERYQSIVHASPSSSSTLASKPSSSCAFSTFGIRISTSA